MLLRDNDRTRLLAIFETCPLPIEVWAYGSRVKGTAHDGSDLDLVVRTEHLQRLPMELYVELCDKIRESNVSILVELRDWTMLPSSFHDSILRNYEVLYDTIHITSTAQVE